MHYLDSEDPTLVCGRCGNEWPAELFRKARVRGRRVPVCWLCRYVAARTPRGRQAALPPDPFGPGLRPHVAPPEGVRFTRTCPRCGAEKPIPEFYLQHATGRRASHCRACSRAARRRAYAADPEKAKAAVLRSRGREDPAQRRRRNRRYARENRAEASIRARTTRLRILGLLTLAERCEDCGRPPALVHHETYGDAAALVSLCRPCHMRRHWRLWRKHGGGPVRYPWEYDQ